MSDNLPAVPTSREIAATDTDSWVTVMSPVMRLSEHICDTEFVPKGLRGSAPKTAAAMLYGREVGLPPMTSLNLMHVVEGSPALSAEGMRSLVYAAGHELRFVETTGALCKVKGKRRGDEEWTEILWTLDMARAAGLAGKNNWKNYPRRMLQARATSELCELIFPDVIHGFRSVEELEDAVDFATGGDGTTTAEQQRTTPVKRTSPRKAAPPARKPSELPAARPAPPADLPLPGEDGYGDPTPQTTEQPGQTTEQPVEPPLPGDDTPEPAADPAEGGGEAPDAGSAEVTLPPSRAMTKPQGRMLFARLSELGVDNDDRDERLAILSGVLGRDVTSSNELTRADAQKLLDDLAPLRDRTGLYLLLDELDAARAQGVDGVTS